MKSWTSHLRINHFASFTFLTSSSSCFYCFLSGMSTLYFIPIYSTCRCLLHFTSSMSLQSPSTLPFQQYFLIHYSCYPRLALVAVAFTLFLLSYLIRFYPISYCLHYNTSVHSLLLLLPLAFFYYYCYFGQCTLLPTTTSNDRQVMLSLYFFSLFLLIV